MSEEMYFDNKKFISAGDASPLCNVTRDHIARICRQGKVDARRVEKIWYVEIDSLLSFFRKQESMRQDRNLQLKKRLTAEYRNEKLYFDGRIFCLLAMQVALQA
jgi:hypothetical protein